jgi:aspartyl-tRNA(Asn)/glutamyl-tRNA(Gln) amidotransferase subunit C
MAIDENTVRRIARLARIRVNDADVPQLASELSSILSWIEKLNEVDTSDVEPMTSVVKMKMEFRPDVVSDGDIPESVLANAPRSEDHFYLVPKIVE